MGYLSLPHYFTRPPSSTPTNLLEGSEGGRRVGTTEATAGQALVDDVRIKHLPLTLSTENGDYSGLDPLTPSVYLLVTTMSYT